MAVFPKILMIATPPRKSINKINQKGERAFAPIEYIKAVKPIVIVDEPQNFETDIRRKAIRNLNRCFALLTTHKNPYNCKLDPVQAYDWGWSSRLKWMVLSRIKVRIRRL